MGYVPEVAYPAEVNWTAVLPFVYIVAIASVSTVVKFVVLVATNCFVRAIPPTSVQDKVRLGNVLLEEPTVTIA